MKCITLIFNHPFTNRGSFGYFFHQGLAPFNHRGLHQGDPLRPFLFTIASVVIFYLHFEEQKVVLQGIKVSRARARITISLYIKAAMPLQ